MSERHNFTDSYIKHLQPADAGQRYIVYDTNLSGFMVRVNDKGDKVFYVYKKFNGTPLKTKIGNFSPALGVEQARKDAGDALTQIRHGENPNDVKKRMRADMTLKQFWDTQYKPRHLDKFKKPTTQDTDTYAFEKRLASLHNRKMLSITHEQIDILHKKIGDESGICGANRAVAILRHIYNKALEWGYPQDAGNPAARVKLFKIENRDRFIQPDEMKQFLDILNAENNEVFRNFVWSLLLTGQRRRNVQAYRWADIDFHNATLYIKETKNGDPLRIPLSKQAMALFTEMKKTADSEWLFPSATSKSGHLEEPKKMWAALLARAKIKNLRMHDMRRTYGSYQAITGAPMLNIGKSLGHKSSQATAIYARLSLDPIRESVQTATDEMFKLANIKDVSNE